MSGKLAAAEESGVVRSTVLCIYIDADRNTVFNEACRVVWKRFGKCSYSGAVDEVYILRHRRSEMKIALGCDLTAAVNGIPANYETDFLNGRKMIAVRTHEGEFFGFEKIGL